MTPVSTVIVAVAANTGIVRRKQAIRPGEAPSVLVSGKDSAIRYPGSFVQVGSSETNRAHS